MYNAGRVHGLEGFPKSSLFFGPRGVASAAHDSVKLGHPCCALT